MLPTYRARMACLAVMLGACEPGGAVEIQFQLPELEELSPAGPAVAEITLVTYLPGAPSQTETRIVTDRSQPIDMGRLAISEGVHLAVELRSPTRQLLGYGRMAAPVEVLLDEVVTIPINLRRPYVYVTGDTSLATFDASIDQTNVDYHGNIAMEISPKVAVSTNDGAELILISQAGVGAELTLLSTSNREVATFAPLELAGSPVDAVVSPNDRYVIVAHAGDSGGVSIVDLAALRAGTATAQFVALGAVGAVATGSRSGTDQVVALVDPASEIGCPIGTPSSLARVSLTDATQVGASIELANPINDLAISDDGRFVVIADGCDDALSTIDLDSDGLATPLTSLSGVSAVAAFDARVWAVGTMPASETAARRLVLLSIGLDGANETRVELPPWQARAVALDYVAPGQAAEQALDADSLITYDLAVVPGADQLALLIRGYYAGAQEGTYLGFPIIPAMELTTHEYLLIDSSTTSIVHRVRTGCDLSWESEPFNEPIIDDWECSRTPGQDIATNPYEPTHVSVLYGAR
jgi:hypothetical protein